MPQSMKKNVLSFLLGLALFAGLMYWIRATAVMEHLSHVGPWIAVVILGYGFAQLSFVLAWRVLLDSEARSIGLWELFRVYLAGDAVNYVVVSGNLAGEPLKAHLLRDRLPMVKGLSSVTINKLSETASMILFQAFGIGFAFAYHLMTPEMAWGSLAVFVCMTIAIALFFWRQKKGLFGWVFFGLSKVGIARAFFERIGAKAERLDAQISEFHDGGGRLLLVSLFFNFLGWCGGAVEGYFLLKLLGVHASLPMVFAIEALSILANNLFFFVPARLGGSDGGKVLVFLSMGMSSAMGFAFGLLRRAREIFYVAVGFVFLIQLNPFRERTAKQIPEPALPGKEIDGAGELVTYKKQRASVEPLSSGNALYTVGPSPWGVEGVSESRGQISDGRESAVDNPAWPPGGPEACLFDFGGTLDADGVAWQDRFYALYEKHGLRVDREAFREAFYFADDSLTETSALLGAGLMETLQTQAERVWKALGLNGKTRQLRGIVTDFFDGMQWHIERNRDLLVLLKSRYKLGIVSNFYGNLERVCEDLGIHSLFLCIVDSSRVGVIKPDPRIFQAALDRLNVRPEHAVFVGDNPGRDMEGAKGLGMPHIWLAGEDVNRRSPCCPGDPVIPSLEGLRPLLLEGQTPHAWELA